MGTAKGLRRRQKPTTKLETSRLVESQRALLCRGEQLLLRFLERGSRQLKLFWASLTLPGPEWIGPMFSTSRIKRGGQREKVASSNRMPRFRIRTYSGRFFTGWDSSKEQVCVAGIFHFLNSRTGPFAV